MNSALSALRADVRSYCEHGDNPPRSRLELVARMLVSTPLQAVVLLRVSQGLARSRAASAVVKWLLSVLTGADISPQARIGPGLLLFHPNGVVIGPGCALGRDCRVLQGVTIGQNGGWPTIGDGVFLGAHAVIHGAVRIGDQARIAANCVVNFDVPVAAVVHPARSSVKEADPAFLAQVERPSIEPAPGEQRRERSRVDNLDRASTASTQALRSNAGA